jgi:hypothetical protein
MNKSGVGSNAVKEPTGREGGTLLTLGRFALLVVADFFWVDCHSTVFHTWVWKFHISRRFHATNVDLCKSGGYASNTENVVVRSVFRGFRGVIHTDEVTGSNPVSPTLL